MPAVSTGQAIYNTPAPPKQPGFFQQVWEHRSDYFYVLPALVVMLIVIAYPIYYTIELSFLAVPRPL